MNDVDMRVLRASHDRERATQLAARICASLGQPPRPLPSRTMLAVESMAWRTALAATAFAIVSLTVGALVHEERTAATSVIARAMDGDFPLAQEVYAWLTGVGAGSGTGQ